MTIITETPAIDLPHVGESIMWRKRRRDDMRWLPMIVAYAFVRHGVPCIIGTNALPLFPAHGDEWRRCDVYYL